MTIFYPFIRSAPYSKKLDNDNFFFVIITSTGVKTPPSDPNGTC